MATAVIMPKQGQTVETCIITKWYKNKGDNVSIGDLLFSFETDKAAFDFESPADGILLDLFFEEGAEVPILTTVAMIGESTEAPDLLNVMEPAAISTDPLTIQPTAEILDLSSAHASPDHKIRISHRAKRIAGENGLNIADLYGSGPDGRIITRDIEKVLSDGAFIEKTGQTTGADEYTEQPLTNIRKLIARAMQDSLQNSAQLTHHMSADVRRLLDTRQRIKSEISAGKSQQNITLNEMLCWCVIRALVKFPVMNSHFLDERIRTFRRVNLGIAVDTPRGLMVPVVKNADDMDLVKLSVELKSVAESCRKGNISTEIIQSTAATFTVSNLGSYGVEMFTPVINLPQAGILGICAIINRPASMGNNLFGFVPYIGLSLTYDHRAIDGGPASLFLKEIKEQIENFSY